MNAQGSTEEHVRLQVRAFIGSCDQRAEMSERPEVEIVYVSATNPRPLAEIIKLKLEHIVHAMMANNY